MTAEEFNEKYKDYIETGFEDQGLEFDYPIITKLLDELFQDLIKIPEFKYSQIKIKFGMSRFYTRGISGKLSDLIENKIDSLLLRYYNDFNKISQ